MKAILLSLACLFTIAWIPECGPRGCGRPIFISLGHVSVTSYQPVEWQTDASPFITADGTDLRETDERICAVSQDMLRWNGGKLRWGDKIILRIPGHPELSGPWVVRDTMAATIYRNGHEVPLVRHVDLLMDGNGKWQGRALLVKKAKTPVVTADVPGDPRPKRTGQKTGE